MRVVHNHWYIWCSQLLYTVTKLWYLLHVQCWQETTTVNLKVKLSWVTAGYIPTFQRARQPFHLCVQSAKHFPVIPALAKQTWNYYWSDHLTASLKENIFFRITVPLRFTLLWKQCCSMLGKGNQRLPLCSVAVSYSPVQKHLSTAPTYYHE